MVGLDHPCCRLRLPLPGQRDLRPKSRGHLEVPSSGLGPQGPSFSHRWLGSLCYQIQGVLRVAVAHDLIVAHVEAEVAVAVAHDQLVVVRGPWSLVQWLLLRPEVVILK